MPSSNGDAKPMLRDAMAKSFKARPALRDNLSQLTRSFFVSGNGDAPRVNAKVVALPGADGDKNRQYEIRLEMEGVRVGDRAFAPPMKGESISERIPTSKLPEYEKLMSAYIPDHLSVDPHPRYEVKPHLRIPDKMARELRYNTTIFNPDERHVYQDTSYPWGAFGRCETNLGPFSGVMIGPRHLLTCNHGVDWNAPAGYAANWLTFTPSFFDGNAPFGSTYATNIYWVKKDNNDGFSNGDEGQYDYVVLVLNDRIGDRTGWLGTRRYTDGWDGLNVWWHIGYPMDLTSMQRPTYQSWFSLNGDDNQDDAHEIIRHQADVFPGQSGGPMFGFWSGDVGPRAVAVQSWQNSSTNGASGGGDLVDLAIRARNDHP